MLQTCCTPVLLKSLRSCHPKKTPVRGQDLWASSLPLSDTHIPSSHTPTAQNMPWCGMMPASEIKASPWTKRLDQEADQNLVRKPKVQQEEGATSCRNSKHWSPNNHPAVTLGISEALSASVALCWIGWVRKQGWSGNKCKSVLDWWGDFDLIRERHFP